MKRKLRKEIHIQDGPYTLLIEYSYPYFVDLRTREEKIRDEALIFISRWTLLNKQFHEKMEKEIPLTAVMERIKCFSREKLKNILAKENWEVRTNENGYEVVILPESDEEEDDSFSEHSVEQYEVEHDESNDAENCDNMLTCEENWDLENDESKHVMDGTINGDSTEEDSLHIPIKSLPTSIISILSSSVECGDTQINETTCSEPLVCSVGENRSISEAIVPAVGVVIDSINSCEKHDVSQNDKNIGLKHHVEKVPELDCGMYETPYNNAFKSVKSNSEFQNPSAQPLSCDKANTQSVDGCNKAPFLETNDVCRECDANNVFSIVSPSTEHSITNYFCCVSVVASPLDTSTCVTSGSQLHQKHIPKCLSLQQINEHSHSPILNTEMESSSMGHLLNGEQKGKFSKSMEGFKSQESCDLHETCSNASRILDSGYPDSYSEHNMDMDLTPEQFDDIATESEENDASSRSLSPQLPPALQNPRVIDDVENGDVANNNRDGEGNNMIADMEEEPMEFEAQIEEIYNEIPNLAAVGQLDQECQLSNRPNSVKLDQEKPTKHCFTMPKFCATDKNASSSTSSQKSDSLDAEIKTILTGNNAVAESVNPSGNSFGDKQTTPSTLSDLSIITNSSWSHLNSTENNTCCNNQDACKLKTHNSLTTLLDGCSKFSNCSLVHPIDKDMCNGLSCEVDSAFENIGDLEDEDVTRGNKLLHLVEGSLAQECASAQSLYQSAVSLNSIILDQNLEGSSFPEWLLNIQLSDTDENDLGSINSVITVWDIDSEERLVELNYDVQVDSRGGGDPQRETWR